MRQQATPRPLALTLILALAACSPGSEGSNATAPERGEPAKADAPAPPVPTQTKGKVEPAKPDEASTRPVAAEVIGLEGLGSLRIGQAPPRGGSWAERGAQTGGPCRTISSQSYPGVYAIVSDGKVQRITVSRRSDVRLAEGIGVGATERDVKKWFGGFREEPHKYEDAPAKYLTAPNAASGGPAVRFEIGRDGKVSLIHVGTMPVLGYVEGCS
jgi:hypothetical protein